MFPAERSKTEEVNNSALEEALKGLSYSRSFHCDNKPSQAQPTPEWVALVKRRAVSPEDSEETPATKPPPAVAPKTPKTVPPTPAKPKTDTKPNSAPAKPPREGPVIPFPKPADRSPFNSSHSLKTPSPVERLSVERLSSETPREEEVSFSPRDMGIPLKTSRRKSPYEEMLECQDTSSKSAVERPVAEKSPPVSPREEPVIEPPWKAQLKQRTG